MKLIEHESEESLGREAAAARLRELADQLARHNELEYVDEGIRYRVAVPDVVDLEIEIEVTDHGGSLEVELSW